MTITPSSVPTRELNRSYTNFKEMKKMRMTDLRMKITTKMLTSSTKINNSTLIKDQNMMMVRISRITTRVMTTERKKKIEMRVLWKMEWKDPVCKEFRE